MNCATYNMMFLVKLNTLCLYNEHNNFDSVCVSMLE